MGETFVRSDGIGYSDERKKDNLTNELLGLLSKSISVIPQLQTDVALINQRMADADFKTICANQDKLTNLVNQHEKVLDEVDVAQMAQDLKVIKDIFAEFKFVKRAVVISLVLGSLSTMYLLLRYFILAGVI